MKYVLFVVLISLYGVCLKATPHDFNDSNFLYVSRYNDFCEINITTFYNASYNTSDLQSLFNSSRLTKKSWIFIQTDNIMSGFYNGILSFAASALGVIPIAVFYKDANSPYQDYKLTMSLVLLSAVTEEVIFRFIGQNSLRSLSYHFLSFILEEEKAINYSYYFGLFVTSIGFGMVHLFNPQRSYLQVTAATIAGFNFGVLYEKKGIFSSISSHATHNLLVFTAIAIGENIQIAIEKYNKKLLPFPIQEASRETNSQMVW